MKNENVFYRKITQGIIPEFISESSTHVVSKRPQRAWKTLNQVQDDNYFKEEALNTFRAPLRSGFTLIELLVVVLIIGILAAVALPQYQLAVAKSRFTQLQTAGDALIKAYKTYYLANGEDPSTLDQLDLLPFGGTLDNTKKLISNGQITCGFNGSYHEFFCSQGNLPVWLYFFPTTATQRNKNKRVCRAYSELAKKVCFSAGGTLKNEGSSYTDYYLP